MRSKQGMDRTSAHAVLLRLRTGTALPADAQFAHAWLAASYLASLLRPVAEIVTVPAVSVVAQLSAVRTPLREIGILHIVCGLSREQIRTLRIRHVQRTAGGRVELRVAARPPKAERVVPVEGVIADALDRLRDYYANGGRAPSEHALFVRRTPGRDEAAPLHKINYAIAVCKRALHGTVTVADSANPVLSTGKPRHSGAPSRGNGSPRR